MEATGFGVVVLYLEATGSAALARLARLRFFLLCCDLTHVGRSMEDAEHTCGQNTQQSQQVVPSSESSVYSAPVIKTQSKLITLYTIESHLGRIPVQR